MVYGSVVKNLPAKGATGDMGSIPGQEDPLQEEMVTHQCSCLENPMDRGAWWATGPGVAKSQTRLSD